MEKLLQKMRLTKDKELYYNCSLDLFCNFDFITEVIKIFKDDFDFIDEVAETYVRNIPAKDLERSNEYIELCILVGLFVPKSSPFYEMYTNRLNGIYSVFLLNVMMIRDKVDDVSPLGFSILLEQHKDRKNILDFFASRFIYEIYHNNPAGSFEDLVHKNILDVNGLAQVDYLEFFYLNLENIDAYLADYVYDHPYILDSISDELDQVIDNWYTYEDRLSDKCVEVIKSWVAKKSADNIYGNDFNYEDAMADVVAEMGFAKMFGVNRRSYDRGSNKVLSFSSNIFKKELRKMIERVIMERMTITELNNFDPDEAPIKKVLTL